MNDPIIDEIRQYRDAYAALFNYDLDAMYADIKQRETKTKKRIQEQQLHNDHQVLPQQPIVIPHGSASPVKKAS